MNSRNMITGDQVKAALALDAAEAALEKLRAGTAEAGHITEFARNAVNHGFWQREIDAARDAQRSMKAALAEATARSGQLEDLLGALDRQGSYGNMTDREAEVNLAADFLPMDRDQHSRPTIAVGGAYVSAFMEGGKLRVWVGLEDTDEEFTRGDDHLVPMEISVMGSTMLDTDEDGAWLPQYLARDNPVTERDIEQRQRDDEEKEAQGPDWPRQVELTGASMDLLRIVRDVCTVTADDAVLLRQRFRDYLARRDQLRVAGGPGCQVYVALFDPAGPEKSRLLGVFGSDDAARAACQEHWQERARPFAGRLQWQDDRAMALDGTYWSRLVERNERTDA